MDFRKKSPKDEESPGDLPEPGELNTDENISGTAHLNDEMAEDSPVDKLEEELQQLKEKYLRLVAEFDNFKKRTAREKLDLMQTANKDTLVSLLDILDDCDRAVKQLESTGDMESFRDGVMLVIGKLKGTLQAKGLREMDAMHAQFSTDLHDAITEIPAPSPELRGKVVDYVQKGYYLNDRIIRHAKVVVGK